MFTEDKMEILITWSWQMVCLAHPSTFREERAWHLKPLLCPSHWSKKTQMHELSRAQRPYPGKEGSLSLCVLSRHVCRTVEMYPTEFQGLSGSVSCDSLHPISNPSFPIHKWPIRFKCEWKPGTSHTPQWAKVLATKPDDRSLIPRIHMVEELIPASCPPAFTQAP